MKQSLTPRYYVTRSAAPSPAYAVVDSLTGDTIAWYRMYEFAYRHANGLNIATRVREVTR